MWRQQGSEVGERREGWAVPVPESRKSSWGQAWWTAVMGSRWCKQNGMVKLEGGVSVRIAGLAFVAILKECYASRVWRAAKAQIGSLDG